MRLRGGEIENIIIGSKTEKETERMKENYLAIYSSNRQVF